MAKKRRNKDATLAAFAKVSQRYEDAKDHYARRRNRDLRYLRFVRGYQAYLITGDSSKIPEEFDDVFNIVRRTVRAATAVRLRAIPNPEFASAADDSSARNRAEASQRLIRSSLLCGIIDSDDMHRAVSMAMITGIAHQKTIWNPDGGRLLPTYGDGMERPQFGDEEDEEDIEVDAMFAEGEIETPFVPCTDLFIDPMARREKEIRYVFHRSLKAMDELRDDWQEDFFGEKILWGEPDLDIAGDDLDDVYDVFSGRPTEVIEGWSAPSKRFPKGNLVVFTGNTLLHYGPNPYAPQRIPFVHYYGDNLVATSLRPDGVIHDLIAPQRKINRMEKQIAEYADTLRGKLLVPHGAMIDVENWTNKSGQIIEHTPGRRPEPFLPGELPTSFFAVVDSNIERIDQLAGYHDITRGRADAAASGRAIAFNQENEEASRQPEMISFKRTVVQLFQLTLDRMAQFYQDGRMVLLLGENGRWIAEELQTDKYELRAQIMMEPLGGAPTSPSLMFGETMELAGVGAFEDTPAAERMRRHLSDRFNARGSVEDGYEDKEKVRRLISSIKKGQVSLVVADTFDDHGIHIDEINKFRKTPEYEGLEPQKKLAIDQWVITHELMFELQQQGMAPPPMDGEPPGPVPAPPGTESPPGGGASVGQTGAPPMDMYSQDPEAVRAEEQQAVQEAQASA